MAPWIPTENFQIKLPFFAESSSPDETFALGERLAPFLEKGSIVALKGPLGAGKTCFVKGIAGGLGVQEVITSATYTIISEYEAFLTGGEPIPVYHIDAYRLRGNDDFTAIGGEDIIFGKGISIIEWSERISDFIPPGTLKVDFEINTDGKRLICVYRMENE